MPRPAAWLVRFSLLYLAAGFTLGGLMLASKGVPFLAGLLWQVLPEHMEILLMGWLVQLAMGVAYWILPRLASGPPRGRESLIWFSLCMLNAGIWLVMAASALPSTWLMLIGRLMELLGVLVFIGGIWRRVKPSGK